MKSNPAEFDVYLRLTKFLQQDGWQIICASPPGGTNTRYRKCLLPRREIGGSQKGPRDEVDLIAHNGKIILLVECKPRLSDSLTVLNVDSESDYDKLKRIANSFPPTTLARLLGQATGLTVPHDPVTALALAVELVDIGEPLDITVIVLGETSVDIRAVEPLTGVFRTRE